MALQSKLFGGDPKLESCAVSEPAHVTPGSVGDHVRKIQQALIVIDGLSIDPGELASKRYGPSTAAAVLAFKRKRNIIRNQPKVDNIVGLLTIAALDKEMLAKEFIPPAPTPIPPPSPEPPAPPEPLSTHFRIRAAGRSGGMLVTEHTDGDPTTILTNEVPTCFQVFDIVNNRRALYSLTFPSQGNPIQELLSPSAFLRSPRLLITPTPLPLSGLRCECSYILTINRKNAFRSSILELRFPAGRASAPMIIHMNQDFPEFDGNLVVGEVGTFRFAKFGFSPVVGNES